MPRVIDDNRYNCWRNMRHRCHRPANLNYKNYGGRGIKVCERWRENFQNFCEDMGARPSEEYSINRIDNDGDYTPDNCEWATRSEQCHNKQDRNKPEHKGTIWKANRSKWWARLRFQGKQISIAYFDNREEANAAYESVAAQLYVR